ncbi:helix-turn-helix domain-containing protein [Streptomyces phaeofaciens]|uniref:helix-turn-helix domain-containing protein n=1 Tax=Streptomyces phaeofaciens TaxID=68254 RepID=UPI0036B64A6C
MEQNAELADFLRTRRARLTPAEAGLPAGTGARRVPGLRREEVAQLAGVSADYYTRLEQGRHPNVSEAVLDAVARALRLDDDERAHLFDLARTRTARPQHGRPQPVQRVRPEVHRMLDVLNSVSPAFVANHRGDVLAANRLAKALITDWEALPPIGSAASPASCCSIRPPASCTGTGTRSRRSSWPICVWKPDATPTTPCSTN